MVLKIGPWYVRRRGAFLALIGVAWVLIGVSYLDIPDEQRPALQHVLRLAVDLCPLWVHGLLWIISGAAAIVDGLLPGLKSAVGFTAAVVMPTAWSLVYLAAWVDGDFPRGYVYSVTFAALAGAITIVAGMPAVRVPR